MQDHHPLTRSQHEPEGQHRLPERTMLFASYQQANRLQVPNRVCVALSRAKDGFFVFGNIDFLASKSELWACIQEKLVEVGALCSGVPIRCRNHGNEQVRPLTAELYLAGTPRSGPALRSVLAYPLPFSLP